MKVLSNKEFVKNIRNHKDVFDVCVDGSTKLGLKYTELLKD